MTGIALTLPCLVTLPPLLGNSKAYGAGGGDAAARITLEGRHANHRSRRDDDRNILTSVSLALEAEGYRINTYTDGVSALDGFKTAHCGIACPRGHVLKVI
jgi:hypothetical protein